MRGTFIEDFGGAEASCSGSVGATGWSGIVLGVGGDVFVLDGVAVHDFDFSAGCGFFAYTGGSLGALSFGETKVDQDACSFEKVI